MTRAELAAHLQAQFSRLAADTKQAATDDSSSGYGPDIDAALRMLGVSSGDWPSYQIGSDDENGAIVLAEYFATLRFARLLAARTDLVAFGVEGDRETAFKNVKALLAMAEQAVRDAGYSPSNVGGNALWSVGRLGLDFIETPVEDWS